MIKEKIAKVEKQMVEALAEVRETFIHSGNKGTTNENNFSDFVRQYLPRKFEIGNGEIIDSHGNRSGQVDIVMVNEYHPFTFTSNKPGLFFIEGVVSAGEIKTTLTTNELENALHNSILYKKLKTNIGIGSLMNADPSKTRYINHPPFFLFCYESQLTLKTIKRNIETFLAKNSIDNLYSIDAVFILNKGWIINFGDGQEPFKFITSDNTSLPGLVINNSKSVLFDLFSYLSATMPNIVRFEPILKNYLFK
jgi:hypothetical protein